MIKGKIKDHRNSKFIESSLKQKAVSEYRVMASGSDNEPAKLLLPYLQRADELQKHEPLVAYYCISLSLYL